MTRIAGIDVGTNAARLLVVDRETGRTLHREERIVRLGEGVASSGLLSADALARTRAVLTQYLQVAESLEVTEVRVIATSATRDAGNAGEFVDLVRGLTGVTPRVLSGDDEARLGFAGVARERAGPSTLLTVDIGGGSTEFVVGTREPAAGIGGVQRSGEPEVLTATSVNLGAVRLAEQCPWSDPPLPEELAASRRCADELTQPALVRALATTALQEWVVVGGTALTIAAEVVGLTDTSWDVLHGQVIGHHAMIGAAHRIARLSLQQRRALPFMVAGREDVIGHSALILATIVQQVEQQTGLDTVTVSVSDLLDGLLWRGLP